MTDIERVKMLSSELRRAADLLSEFPATELAAAMTDRRVASTIDMMIEHRRKSVAVFREIAVEFNEAGKAMDLLRLDIRKLQSLQENLTLLKGFTDTLERLAALEKSGFVSRIKPLLQ